MTSKERVIKTLTLSNPDRLPIDLWLLPATITKYKEKVTELLNEIDFAGVTIHDPTLTRKYIKRDLLLMHGLWLG